MESDKRSDQVERFGLARLLPQEPEQQYDLTRLTDDELRIVTHLLGKAAGEPVKDVIDTCLEPSCA